MSSQSFNQSLPNRSFFRFSPVLFAGFLAFCPVTLVADETVELSPVTVEARPVASSSGLPYTQRHDSPASVTTISQQQLQNHHVRTTKDLVKEDNSLQSSYAPVGYYQNLAIRGFALDWAKSYRQNNLTVAGEQLFAPEDKAQVQVLKGMAGIDAGVITPGGMINYVSKRPDNVRQISLGVDQRGSHYQALDAGRWLTDRFGVRVNLARNDEASYVDHADGRRFFYAIAADWWATPRSLISLDSNYQTSSQRSVSGYQLLGGTELPRHVKRSRSLGYQPWQPPVDIKSSNTSLRWQYALNDDWQMELSGGHSQSIIDDATAFAYGQSSDATAPYRFFAPNGDYDIYDFRAPDDKRVNDEIRLQFNGEFELAGMRHESSFGVEWSQRLTDGREWVYDWLGSSNIQQNPPVLAPSSLQPGDQTRLLTHRENAIFLLQRWHVNAQWQLLAGARSLILQEKMYGYDGALYHEKTTSRTLPQAAIVWQPQSALKTWLSYSKGLSLGQQAPFWTDNAGDILASRTNQQWELGAHYQLAPRLALETTLYRLEQPNQYAMPDSTPSGFTFVAKGEQVHHGIELTLNGAVTDSLNLQAGLNLVHARLQHTHTPDYEKAQVINVPTAKASLQADYQLPFIHGLHLLGGWHYASRNPATPDGSTKAPAYHLFDAGLRYQHAIGEQQLIWRLQVDNLSDRFYWSDTGGYLGDNYLFYGAPRTARLSLNWSF